MKGRAWMCKLKVNFVVSVGERISSPRLSGSISLEKSASSLSLYDVQTVDAPADLSKNVESASAKL